MKHETIIFILKIIVAICTGILSVLGVCAFSSCSSVQTLERVGRTTILTTDTTYINHNGNISIKFSK